MLLDFYFFIHKLRMYFCDPVTPFHWDEKHVSVTFIQVQVNHVNRTKTLHDGCE